MKQFDIFDEMTYIDDDLILEAHETPVPRHSHLRLGSLYRAAAVLAAVLMVVVLSVGAVAVSTDEWKMRLFALAQEQGFGFYWEDREASYQTDADYQIIDGREIPYSFISISTKEWVEDRFVCENEVIRSQLEVMILMNDGRMVYKSHTMEGEGEITNTVDNLLGDEAGTIVSVRRLITIWMGEEWEWFHKKTLYLSYQQGVQLPAGTDTRFPEMRYNYDGRANGGPTEPEAPSQIIVQNETDVIMIFE